MKHFFGRINRGIALGIVLLIGLSVFIWQDELSFQKETPGIEKNIAAYLEATAKANVFDPSLQKIGAVMTAKQQSDKLQEYNDILNQYWSEANSTHSMDKDTLAEQMKDLVSQNSEGSGYIQKCTVKLDDTPKVTKSGPGTATVEISYTLVLEYAGLPAYFSGDYPTSVSRTAGSGKRPGANETVDPKRKRLTAKSDFQLEMEKINSAWKIISLGSASGSGAQITDIE